MGKLFNLRDWLTVADAARHLSVVFGEEVTEADVLRLALDGRLKLSINFVNHALGQLAKFVSWNEFADNVNSQRGTSEALRTDVERVPEGDQIKLLHTEDRVITLTGVQDLPMLGAEYLDIEHKYQMMTGGVAVELRPENLPDACIPGALISSSDGQMYLLVTQFSEKNHYPDDRLPKDAVIVVRTSALRELEHSMNRASSGQDKPLATTERNSLLTIIAALCKYEGLDPQARGTAQRIMEMTDDLGAHVDDGTIRTALAKIPDALETRQK